VRAKRQKRVECAILLHFLPDYAADAVTPPPIIDHRHPMTEIHTKKESQVSAPVIVIMWIEEDGRDVEQTPAGNHQMRRRTCPRGYCHASSDTSFGKWKGRYAYVEHSHGGG
jgi:hypothetical protein